MTWLHFTAFLVGVFCGVLLSAFNLYLLRGDAIRFINHSPEG